MRRLLCLSAAALVAASTLVSAVTADPDPSAGAVSTSTSNQWVTRSGAHLRLAGKPWRFTGVNMYWLGLDENVTDSAGPTYPSHAAVDNAMSGAVAIGAKLVRSTTLGVSVGSARSLEPRLDVVNAKAFSAIDYAVAAARRHGLRLMIPLTDEWHYYHGGKHTFTNWLGRSDVAGQNVVTSNVQRSREATFYTDADVIGAFHRYIATLLNHRNPLTGLRLGSDPTIAIWETGNELWDAPPAWTQQTAAYIKQLAPRSLVADGSAASGKNIAETGYAGRDVDIVDGHFYPTAPTKMAADAYFAAFHKKAYMVGEYPLTADPRPFLDRMAPNTNVAGSLAWSLFPWLAGRPEQHEDGYTFHVPGATVQERTMVDLQRRFAARVGAVQR